MLCAVSCLLRLPKKYFNEAKQQRIFSRLGVGAAGLGRLVLLPHFLKRLGPPWSMERNLIDFAAGWTETPKREAKAAATRENRDRSCLAGVALVVVLLVFGVWSCCHIF